MDKAALIEFFNRIAPEWDRWKQKNWYYHREIERLYSSLIPPGSRVLELGCATGDLLNALRPSHGVGVDFSPEMIRIARQKYPQLTFEVTDAEDPLPSGPYEYLVISNLVGYLGDIWSTLRRLSGLVTPQTRIVMTYYNYLWEPLLKAATFLRLKTPMPPQNWLPLPDLANLLSVTNFEVIRQGRRLLVPVPIPLLAPFLNRFLAVLPGLKRLGVIEYLVARPIFRNGLSQEATCSVIIPCRNEEGNIEQLVERMPALGSHTELIFVDGNSTDGTRERIEALMARDTGRKDITLLSQGTVTGKGHAVRMGFEAAHGEILMILDADMTVVPEDLEQFYRVIQEGHGELVIGSRLVYPMERQAMRFLNLMANHVFSLIFTALLEQRITDTLCGTKVIRKRDYEKIVAGRSFFGDFDPYGDFDLIFGAARLNLKITELPVRYRERVYGVTKISRFRHGWLLLQMCGVAMRKLKFV